MREIFPTTEQHRIGDVDITLHGASHSVTGSMTRVELGTKSLLIDCGVGQGQEARRFQVPDDAHRVDAVLLTHGHNDHVGSLPVLIDRGYSNPILGTRATLAIARIVLEDGLRLNQVASSARSRFLRAFDELARPVVYDSMDAHLAGLDATFAFREAGHILGSASVELVAAGKRFVFSGDLGRPDSPILRTYHTAWTRERDVDFVLMESTYGDSCHAQSHDDVRNELERVLHRAMEHGGQILVPAFAIGRTQTLLYHLNALVEAGRVKHLPVAVDTPMGLAVTETYEQFRDLFDREATDRIAHGDDPLSFDSLYAVHRAKESARLRDFDGPMLVIAGNGMCTGGRIVGHLQELLPVESTCVLFVGFQAPGTTGREIQQAARTQGSHVRVGGQDVVVNAHVETLPGLSAHADRDELSAWLDAIPGNPRVGLHHGEPDAQRSFADFYMARPEPR